MIGRQLDSMNEMEEFLTSQCQDIDYTIVRPPRLVDEPLKGKRFKNLRFKNWYFWFIFVVINYLKTRKNQLTKALTFSQTFQQLTKFREQTWLDSCLMRQKKINMSKKESPSIYLNQLPKQTNQLLWQIDFYIVKPLLKYIILHEFYTNSLQVGVYGSYIFLHL